MARTDPHSREISIELRDPSMSPREGHIGWLQPRMNALPDPRRTAALIVGPPVMYKYALLEVKAKEVPKGNIWLSLERRMKCGLGKCGHCQINNYYVCQEGPVFTYPQVEDKEEAL